ncbi:MAG: ATP-binding protein, partial [Muribaculaceae bacterium]
MPENSDLAKTMVAFANDAGGDLYIGVADDPREVIGLDEEKLMAIEEKISNILFDRCYPA